MENEDLQGTVEEPAASTETPPAPRARNRWLFWMGAVAVLFVAVGWWWYDINVMPTVNIPPAPPLPAHNAVAAFVAAANVIVHETKGGGLSAIEFATTFDGMPQPDRVALLERNAAVFTKLQTALALPYVEPGTRTADSYGKHWSSIRALAHLLDFTAKTRAAGGDWAGSLDASLDGLDMSSRLTKDTTLMGGLVGIFSESLVRKPAWDAVPHLNTVTARADARRLEKMLTEHPLDAVSILREEKYTGQAQLLVLFNTSRKKLADTFDQADALTNIFGTPKTPLEQKKRYLAILLFHKRHAMTALTQYDDAYAARAAQPRPSRAPVPP